jgi:predicted glutamine amidotransferase
MCGLVGVAGDIRYNDVKVFEQMLLADTFRGVHSTGIATLGKSKTHAPEILKASLPAWEFLDRYEGADRMASTSDHIIMGHNRHATQGAVNGRNAHPFYVEEDLFGMHNGTLTTYPYRAEFGTDSEATLASLVRQGERETLESITGAWALVWYNYANNTLNFTRNSERPLTLAMSKDSKQLYWASERKMLEWILDRNNINEVDFLDLPTCEVYSFTMPEELTGKFEKPKVWSYTEKKWYAPVVSGYQKATTPTNTTSTGTTNTESRGGNTTGPGGIFGSDLVKRINDHLFPDGFDPASGFDDWVHTDHQGVYLIGAKTREAYTQGCECATCGSPIDPEERWRAFPKPYAPTFICQDCAESPDAASTLFWCGVDVA